MNIKNIAIAAMIAITSVGTMAIATDKAFANDGNQITLQSCGDKFKLLDTECQNIASLIQDDEHAASLTSQQTFEEEKKENTPALTDQQSITPSIVLPH